MCGVFTVVGVVVDDVCIIQSLQRNIDVQVIDNHQSNNIPIVTSGGITKTRHVEVIVILNQYAYTGKVNCIHSSSQIE